RLPFFKQDLAGLEQRLILVRRLGRVAPRQSGGEKRLVPVRFHSSHTFPFDGVERIRIGGDNFSGRQGFRGNLSHQVGAQESFAIVFENNCVGPCDAPPKISNDARDLRRGGGTQLFAI